MREFKINPQEIKNIIRDALNIFYEKDSFLFTRNGHRGLCERCLTFRFAHQLQKILDERYREGTYFVDCDFNSSGFKDENGDFMSRMGKAIPERDENGGVKEVDRFVDIIVHKRINYENRDFRYEENNDVFCMEIKKWNNVLRSQINDENYKDKNNLRWLTSLYGYQLGIWLIFGKERNECLWEIYDSNRENNLELSPIF